jgi:serine/threonine protein kinase
MSVNRRIDQICDEFEACWNANEHPSIFDFLKRVEGADQVVLLSELLALDVEYRIRFAMPVVPEDYAVFGQEAVRLATALIADLRSPGTAEKKPQQSDSKHAETLMQYPVIPGYEIDSVLGRGGMGIVYRCRQTSTGTTVALKLMLQGRGASHEALVRFRIEAEALACLDHQNITRILDIGVVSGCPYFVTEFASNGTILDFAARNKKPLDWYVDAIRKTALAVHHANRRWMIHRDIKPANILIFEDETPKIADFGLVKFTTAIRRVANVSRIDWADDKFGSFDRYLQQFSDELAVQYRQCPDDSISAARKACLERTGLPGKAISLEKIEKFLSETVIYTSVAGETPFPELDMLTKPNAIFGSPQFMAPEQARGQLDSIDPRTDVYGLAASLYWLLTGKPVFTGSSIYEILTKIRGERDFPIRAAELNSDIPMGVDCVLWKALQKHPTGRYENCKVFADELDCCLKGTKPNAQYSHEQRLAHQAKLAEETHAEKERSANLFKNAFPPKN